MDFLKRYHKMIALRGLSDHTVISYTTYITAYLDYVRDVLHKCPTQVKYSDIIKFLNYLKESRGLSDRTINAAISQIRFFTLYVLHKQWDPYQIPMRKFDTFLPYVPTREEALHFIDSITDIKRRAAVCLLYSAGLRVGEVCHLRYEDISRKRMDIHVRHSKNRHDRYAILSSKALDILTEYWLKYQMPRGGYLFPKRGHPDEPMCTFTLMRWISEHEEALGLAHKYTCHTFRHAFGTHLYENGADLLVIKEMLGHRSLGSTMIYVHLASVKSRNFKSPFDVPGGAL